jgi:hypothetical protein
LPIAQAGLSVSTPPAQARSAGATGGFLRVVSPAQLNDQDQAQAAQRAASRRPLEVPDLGSWIRNQWWIFRNHRNLGNNPINQRLLRAQRMFEGKYDAEKLAQIQAFGGSEVYSRQVANKCRGATSLLRDVYLGPERPWDIQPQPDPPIPPDVRANIIQLISTEVQTLQMSGQPAQSDQVHMRYVSLLHSAQAAARRNAITQADAAADKIDDILTAGGFYEAIGEFLQDLPLFPYAVLKGPVVRMVPKLTWIQGQPSMQLKPTMFWERVNPFDIYWSPGASNLADAAILERKRYTRADLNDLIGVPGYDEAAVRAALDDYSHGLREWLDAPDPEQAINEGREDPSLNRSQYIEGIEFHGCVQGETLLDQGVNPKLIPDSDREYMIQSWVVGRHTLKTMINPSPRQRHPYYLTSFEKVPGTVAGHALPDILEDIQEVANAAYRALVNNLSISSGPQVIINDEMVSPTESGDELYPWKRWHVQGDPLGNQRDPISFFQPQSNVQELLLVIQNMNTMADEQSAIPRYLTGESLSGGAGRTASGLSMLMNNAAKVLQTVAANVDTDVMEPVLEGLYDMIMLTDTSGILTGEEQIRVKGSEVQAQRDTERQKQLQFLQITANPIDAPIIGEIGRARVLRAIAKDLGLPDDIVPDDQTLQSQIDAQKRMQAAGQALVAHAQGQGADPGPGANGPIQGHRQVPPGVGGAAPGGQAGPGGPNPGSAAQGKQAPTPTPARHADFAPPVNSFSPSRGVQNG